MAAARKLKVFRTATGFHDAYVAAPSRKAALQAWGADKDLFALGSAELVTDPALTKEPLKHPGEVIKRSRGSLSEQLAALPTPTRAKSPDEPTKPRPRKSKPRPPPSRKGLDEAEAAVIGFGKQSETEIAALRTREEELRREREAIEQLHQREASKLDAQLSRARNLYERALSKWREDT